MKKILIAVSTLIALWGTYVFSQQDATKPAGGMSGSGSAVTNFPIDDFEDAGAWQGHMPIDLGLIRVLRREGAPGELKKDKNSVNKYVLGAKVAYFKTGPSWFAVTPPREIAIPGVAKSLSLWVAGRSFSHVLKATFRDYNSEIRFCNFGKLNFPGWQKLTAQISPNIAQDNYKLNSADRPRGIKISGLLVECAMDETSGEYFLYVDDFKAQTDMFFEDNRDVDDLQDNW